MSRNSDAKINERRQERIDTYWENSIRIYLRQEAQKHPVKLVNCSESGLCIDVPKQVAEFFVEDRANLLFQVGKETCAFSAIIRWVAPVCQIERAASKEARRYGAKIDRGTETNAGLYRDYVRFLFMKRRFQETA